MALLSDGRLPSSVYGAEHLLRLFVKLPELLAAAGAGGMSEEVLVQTATAVQVCVWGGGAIGGGCACVCVGGLCRVCACGCMCVGCVGVRE